MYVLRTYVFKNSIEIEKKHTHRFRKKGQKRNQKSNPTPETMKKYNLVKQVDYLRRLIKLNFYEGYHMVLTYDKNDRPTPELAKKQLNNFIARMRYHLKKQGVEFKYITVTEYENKALHHHIIIQDIPGILKLVTKQWKHGQVNFTPMHKDDDVDTLANYLIKETSKTFKEDGVHKTRYNPSRNLEKPTYTEKIIMSNSFRKDPVVPKGYILDRDSYVYGVSEVTGYEYQKYTLIKIRAGERMRI